MFPSFRLRRNPTGSLKMRSCQRPSGPQRTFEALENRLLLYAVTGSSWANTNVSASFLPDGTSTEGYASSLFAELNAVAPTATWQREFARALQTWANSCNLNFRFVPDDGSPSGTSGLAQGDSRFGDVRLGSHPLSNGYVGYAYYPGGSTLGGDVTLSPDYTFHIGTYIDLYSVLLHEAGHALGLGHSTSGTVMYGTITGVYAGLTADDIAGIQAIYGARRADVYDASAANDTLSSATSLLLDASGAVSIRADLTTRADMDFFQVVVPSGSDGTLTVSLDARNLSLLAPKLAVYDSAGNLVAIADAGSAYGSVVTISLSGLVAGQRYTLMVDGASSDAFGMGGYRLNLQFGGIIVTPPGLNPDRYEPNDLWATANDFGRINSLSQTGLTLHSSSDVDYYTFVARSSATFNVSILFSQASGNLDLTVYDASGNVLASGTSQSDNESVSLSLVSGQRYYLKVASPGGDQNGYDLLVQKIGSSSASSKGSQKGGKASAEEELGHGTELGADTMPILQAVDNPQNRRDLSRTQGLAEIPVAPAPFAQSDPLSGVRGVMVAPLQAPRQEAERFRKADRVLEQWDDWDWDGLLDGLAKVVIRSP